MQSHTNGIVQEYDVVICGAGLSGLALARQLKRELPNISCLLIEGLGDKGRTGAIQVGESTIELSANYLANTLGLREYLETSHYHKWGLRFFFGDSTGPFQDRPEYGTSHASPITSYQLDRALLETDLKQMNTAADVQMLPESKVERIELASGDGLHEITLFEKTSNQRHTIKSRWVIDAMGRRRFLQRQLGIAAPKNPRYSASWFRLKGRIDIGDLVPPTEYNWHQRVPGGHRYFSTNHLMGDGRWVWLIPLASGHTSIGIVTNEDFFSFDEYNTFEKSLHWLQKHEPILWNLIRDQQPVDFQCLRHYSYTAKQVFSFNRWACTGDAAVFADPFFSPGIDQIGFANTIITALIKRDRDHCLALETVERLNEVFLGFHNGLSWIIQPAYAFYGDALVMGAKLTWDFARGFSINAAQRFNHIYLDEQKSEALQSAQSQLFQLTLLVEKLLKAWAQHRAATTRGNNNAYAFIDYFALPGMLELYKRNFQAHKTVEELVADHTAMLNYFEELAQIIFLIALADTMPGMLDQLPSPLWLNAWGIGLDTRRWKANNLFSPTSPPRKLWLTKFASVLGVTDLVARIPG